jgi:hypothetical protein
VGVPRLRVSGLYAQDGARKFAGVTTAVCKRYFVEVGGTQLSATATNVRLLDIAKGHRITRLMLKTGVKDAAQTAGNDAFITLSDTILQNIRLNLGLNRFIRSYPDMFALQSETLHAHGLQPAVGYGMIDFCKSGDLRAAMNTAPYLSGPNGDTSLYLSGDVTGAASQALVVVVEELRYAPKFPTATARRR